MELEEKEAGKSLTMHEYSIELQKDIEKSWEGVFDLDRCLKEMGVKHRRNLSIQATFWALKPEYIVSVEFLEKKGDVIRQIAYQK